jgi:hypothetical protein
MSNVVNFQVIGDAETGIVLQCNDVERADQFDDFLAENLDQEIFFKFCDTYVLFYFGKQISVFDITALYKKFEQITTKQITTQIQASSQIKMPRQEPGQ